MSKFDNVIAIKIYFSPTVPLGCKDVLKKVAMEVYKKTLESSWRVVLYQQWAGDTAPVLAGLNYIQESQATRSPKPEDVTLIEITVNQPCNERSRQAVDAARSQLIDMFHEVPILINYLSYCTSDDLKCRL